MVTWSTFWDFDGILYQIPIPSLKFALPVWYNWNLPRPRSGMNTYFRTGIGKIEKTIISINYDWIRDFIPHPVSKGKLTHEIRKTNGKGDSRSRQIRRREQANMGWLTNYFRKFRGMHFLNRYLILIGLLVTLSLSSIQAIMRRQCESKIAM